MAGFAYFLSGATKADLLDRRGRVRVECLQRFGLEHVLRDVTDSPRDLVVEQVAAGARREWGGHAGLFIVPVPITGNLPTPLQFGEHWDGRLHGAGEDYETRICWHHDAAQQPQPDDLERRRIVPGYSIQDNTGQRWLYPAVRGLDHYPAPYGGLPGDWTFEADGSAKLVLSPDYQQLWAMTARVWDHLTGAEPVERPVSPAELAQIALAALAVNYRIGPGEIAVLQTLGRGVINSHNLPVILQAICDVESVERYLTEKKTDGSPPASAGLSSAAGCADETPDTNPREVNNG